MASPTAKETKIRRIIDSSLLRDNSPQMANETMQVLLKIMTNIAKHPGEDKFKEIRSQAKAFQPILLAKGGLDILVEAGFKKTVKEFVEYWKYYGTDVSIDELPAPIELPEDAVSIANLHLFASNAPTPSHPLLLVIYLLEAYKYRADVRAKDADVKASLEKTAGKRQIEKVLLNIEIDRQERKERDERARLNRKMKEDSL
jgi:hypothetical protein